MLTTGLSPQAPRSNILVILRREEWPLPAEERGTLRGGTEFYPCRKQPMYILDLRVSLDFPGTGLSFKRYRFVMRPSALGKEALESQKLATCAE